MSEKDFLTKTLTDTLLSRRSFLKWSAALGGTAVLAGGINYGLKTARAAAKAAAAEGEWITAACWHNCGGQRCLLKAQVVDGVVQKVKTDDTHEESENYPQLRACARGRSQEHHCLGVDRLKYPMKRKNWAPGGGNKELRGQDEWVRISWDEAFDIVATELTRIKDQYGNTGILELGSGLRSTLRMIGGAVSSWGSTSWGTWLDSGPIVGLGDGLSFTSNNDRLDMRKSQLIVLWGSNTAWSSQGNAMKFYLDAKRAGAKFIFIDPWYNDTAMVLADEWIPIRPGTDHTMLLGMAYTLITEDDPVSNQLIDWDFLERCTIGFDRAHMPEGADPKENFKDYVLGTYDKVPKTPEWASEYCGVPAYKIREIAYQVGGIERVALLTAWAPARTNNSDSWPQMFMTLGAMTGHIGKSGSMTGVSCWERTANGGNQFLVGSGGSGVPGIEYPDYIRNSINNNQVWDAVLTGEYISGYQTTEKVDIQAIIHDGSSALNQKVGMTKGIEAHRKVEFVLSMNFVLNTNSKYSDVVLPVTTQWERAGYFKGNREHLIWARKVVDPLFEAKDDDWINAELGARLGFDPEILSPLTPEQIAFNQLAGCWVLKSDGVTRETLVTITADDIAEMGVEGEPQTGRITVAEFMEKGIYAVPRSEGDKFTYIAHQAFREDPENNPLKSATGKLEIYSQALVDDIKNRGFTEIRPIPTYNPPTEGYEDTFSDWENKVKGDYPLQLFTCHYRRRSHSILNNVPWLREAFPQEFGMNPIDAEERGLKKGDIVQVTSRHGTVIRPLFITERVKPGVCYLGEGAWAEVDEASGIDKAGATNTLNGAIPTGQGHQGWNTCNIQVEKYTGPIELLPDYKWPQRIPIEEA
jgi:anaerobic dimethyl sulfoxide reductase subunit A